MLAIRISILTFFMLLNLYCSAKPLVYVGLPPLEGIVKQIAGDRINVKVIINNQFPDVQPKIASNIYDIATSSLILSSESYSEQVIVKEILDKYKKANIKFVDSNINKINVSLTGINNGLFYNTSTHNPYIWNSLPILKQLTLNIYRELSLFDPDNSSIYKKNMDDYIDSIKQLEIYIDRKMVNLRSNKFIVIKPEWLYFTKDYGIEQVLYSKFQGYNLSEQVKMVQNYMGKEQIIMVLSNSGEIQMVKDLASVVSAQVIILDGNSNEPFRTIQRLFNVLIGV